MERNGIERKGRKKGMEWKGMERNGKERKEMKRKGMAGMELGAGGGGGVRAICYSDRGTKRKYKRGSEPIYCMHRSVAISNILYQRDQRGLNTKRSPIVPRNLSHHMDEKN
jgi:hypothetical protein